MATAVHTSLAAYMQTEYEPDCDYVDGVLEERNVGKRKHSRTQTRLARWLDTTESQRYQVLVEQRVRVAASRVRIPDICLIDANDNDEVTQHPPLLCIEILSPEDRWPRVQERLDDFLAFGVPMIWIIDPYSNQAWTATPGRAVVPVTDGVLRCADLELEVALSDVLPEE